MSSFYRIRFWQIAMVILCGIEIGEINPGQAQVPADFEGFTIMEEETGTKTWEQVFRAWLRKAKVSGGIFQDETALRKLLITTHKAKPMYNSKEMEKMLDEMCTENPHYQWIKDKDSINILPKKLNVMPIEILNNPVKSFHIKTKTATQAIYALLKKNNFPIRYDYRNAFGGPKPKYIPPKEYSCSDMTVLQCINHLAKYDAEAFWNIYYSKRGKEYLLSPDETTDYR